MAFGIENNLYLRDLNKKELSVIVFHQCDKTALWQKLKNGVYGLEKNNYMSAL